MPGDNSNGGVTPRINRTNSVFPQTGPLAQTYVGPVYANDKPIFIPLKHNAAGMATSSWQDQIPPGFEVVKKTGDGIWVRPKAGDRSPQNRPIGPTTAESAAATQQRVAQQQFSKAQADKAQVDYAAAVAQSQANHYTINGVDVYDPTAGPVEVDSKGKPVPTQVGGYTDPASPWTYSGGVAASEAQAASVFSALNLDQVDGSARVLMSIGAPLNNPANPNSAAPEVKTQDLPMRGKIASMQTDAQRYGKQQNLMTISEAVNWFRNLSVKDPEAYDELIKKLWRAGYINASDPSQLPLGGFSSAAAQQFALALSDLAQANQAGDQTPLNDWLDKKAAASDQAAANLYQPVDRQFTDPASVQAAAQAAAEQALGRGLTDQEKARFTDYFKGLETQVYDQIDAAGKQQFQQKRAGQPITPTTVTRPDLSGEAQSYIDQNFGTEKAGQLMASYADKLRQMVGL